MYSLYHADRSQQRCVPPAWVGAERDRRGSPPPAPARRRTGGVELPWLDVDANGASLAHGVAVVDGAPSCRPAPDRRAVERDLAHIAADGSALAGRIVPATGGEYFYWFTPTARGVRGLAVGIAAFAGVLDHHHRDRQITGAEARTLFQLVAGAGPREAALADGLSFETKRAQIKSLCAKLDCSGQTDLVRHSVGLLVRLLRLTEQPASD